MSSPNKPIRWIGSSRDDLRDFPAQVRNDMGFALFEVQSGKKPNKAKPAEGFKGASVLKIVEDYDGDTYRAVYTVRFEEAIYVLHCFQKKSKSGIATPKQDLDLIQRRYRQAEREHQKWQKETTNR